LATEKSDVIKKIMEFVFNIYLLHRVTQRVNNSVVLCVSSVDLCVTKNLIKTYTEEIRRRHRETQSDIITLTDT